MLSMFGVICCLGVNLNFEDKHTSGSMSVVIISLNGVGGATVAAYKLQLNSEPKFLSLMTTACCCQMN